MREACTDPDGNIHLNYDDALDKHLAVNRSFSDAASNKALDDHHMCAVKVKAKTTVTFNHSVGYGGTLP